MTISFDHYAWHLLHANVPGRSIAVKTNGTKSLDGGVCFGLLAHPPLVRGVVRGDSQMYARLMNEDKVVVIGHGSLGVPTEIFIWRGTPAEFGATWKGD